MEIWKKGSICNKLIIRDRRCLYMLKIYLKDVKNLLVFIFLNL